MEDRVKLDLLAYLTVLCGHFDDDTNAFARITSEEWNAVSASDIVGCLHRVCDYLSSVNNNYSRLVLDSILEWERNNGSEEPDDSALRLKCAKYIVAYLRNEPIEIARQILTIQSHRVEVPIYETYEYNYEQLGRFERPKEPDHSFDWKQEGF